MCLGRGSTRKVVELRGTVEWIGDLDEMRSGRDTPQTVYLSRCLDEDEPEVALTDLILTEILQGLRTEREVQRVGERLSVFEVLRLRDVADFRRAAALHRSARRQGVTVRRTSDCLIAAVCIREQVALLHTDNDFDHLASVTELSVVAPGRS